MGFQARPAPFIVGAGRSGTTLLRMMLDAHPELAIPPETHFIPALSRVWATSPRPVDAVLDELRGHEHWPDFRLDPEALRDRIDASAGSELGDVLRAFYVLYAEQQGKQRWGDKTPRYVMAMPLIGRLIPEAHFIHIIRDGRDVALSVRDLWFGPASLEEAAVWWKKRVETGRRAGARLAYTEVRYETLVRDPRSELQRVCRAIELEFREEMLSSHARASERLAEEKALRFQGISAASRRAIHPRLEAPVDSRAVGRWRAEMSADERRRFIALAGDTLEALGYPVD